MKNFTDLTGKKAIVTGAAQGLCHGMAEGLMEAGAEVCIIDINPKTPEVAKEFCDRGFTCHSVIANLGDAESILKNGFEDAVKSLGRNIWISSPTAGCAYRIAIRWNSAACQDSAVRLNIST